MPSYMRTGSNTGLGDYIHLKKENYLRYGFFRSNKGGTSSQNYFQCIAIAHQRLKNMAKETRLNGDVETMQEMLTAVYRRDWESQILKEKNIDLTNIEKREKEMETAILSKMPEGYLFDRKELAVQNSATLEQMGNKLYKRYINKTQKTIKKSTLKKIQDTLIKNIDYLNDVLSKGQGSPRDIKNKQQEIIYYNSLLEAAIQNIEASGKNDIKIRNSGTNQLSYLGQALVNISRLKVNMGYPTSTEIGTTGEIGVAAFLYALDNRVEIAKEEILSSLVGEKDKGSANKSNRSDIYAKFQLDEEKSSEIKTTQDTVDISLNVSNTDLFGAKTINASVKNYNNFNYGVGLISSVTLETILGLTGSAFANHYLNRIAEHEDGVVQSLPAGDNVVAYALAVRALTGRRYDTFKKLSNYFITVNRSQKKIYVYNSYDILERISPRPERFDYSLVNITGLPVQYGSFLNAKVANVDSVLGATARITKLMGEVRKRKLSMSLTPKFFST